MGDARGGDTANSLTLQAASLPLLIFFLVFLFFVPLGGPVGRARGGDTANALAFQAASLALLRQT